MLDEYAIDVSSRLRRQLRPPISRRLRGYARVSPRIPTHTCSSSKRRPVSVLRSGFPSLMRLHAFVQAPQRMQRALPCSHPVRLTELRVFAGSSRMAFCIRMLYAMLRACQYRHRGGSRLDDRQGKLTGSKDVGIVIQVAVIQYIQGRRVKRLSLSKSSDRFSDLVAAK